VERPPSRVGPLYQYHSMGACGPWLPEPEPARLGSDPGCCCAAWLLLRGLLGMIMMGLCCRTVAPVLR
jgi:hypothetical protein